ncbi:MAG: hypothetical protein IT331_13950 [Anaerolineae bacterium]|nr:hypothetical protein [Anaerolineae bacterium]
MAEINVTQAEADLLLAMEKHRVDEKDWDYPGFGGYLRIPLISPDKRENFFLDIERNSINLSRGKYQNRSRQVIILARLDFGGPPHRNPDGQEMPCPHIHLYREGYADKWAIPLPNEHFPNPNDPWQTLQDFMRFCHITLPPMITRGLHA